MAVTDGKIQLEDADLNQIEISVPVFGYKTTILLPFDIQKLDTGLYGIYDHGASYDIRKCNCTFMLSATEMNTLNTFLKEDNISTSKGRAYNVTLRMNTGSGFFPYGADKGDVGDFTTAMTFTKHGSVGESPFNYFICDVEMVNVGTFPAYVLPAEVSDGAFTFGTITECRFPPDWFSPAINYGYYATIKQNSTVEWIDRGENADWFETQFDFRSNESKTAAVINYITGTSRGGAFNIATPAGYRPFGSDIGDGTFSVRLIQDKIEITHHEYNLFSFPITLSYESTV
jgi:hypothetical protein